MPIPDIIGKAFPVGASACDDDGVSLLRQRETRNRCIAGGMPLPSGTGRPRSLFIICSRFAPRSFCPK